MTPARFRWGMLLILIGVLILLRNFSVVQVDFWWDLLIYSPFLLIAIGIEKIFTGSRLQFISYLATLALVCGALYLAFEREPGLSGGNFFSKSTFMEEADPSVNSLHATLELGEGDLTIRDASDHMVYGRFREFTRKPEITYSLEGSDAKVTFDARSKGFWNRAIVIESSSSDDWYLSFSRYVPLYLECFGDRSDIHMNLATTPLRKLNLQADDAEIYLKLGDLLPRVGISISGDDTTLRLRVPRDAGLRVSGKDYRRLLSKIGLIEENGNFVNDGYDTLQSKINVDLDDRFRSLSIDFY